MNRSLAAPAAVVACLSAVASAQDCTPTLQPFTEGLSGYAQFNGAVFDAVTFDDGSGPALYVAGAFTAPAMPSARLVRFRPGEGWTAVGNGLNFTAYALQVHDDGSGPSLFVGGNFSNASGVPAACMARWDGSAFHPVGAGFNHAVTALAVYEGALYAAGEFTMSGSQPLSHIARWDGSSWSALGSGIDPNNPLDVLTVRDMHVHDDGSGAALYVGGGFWSAGGIVTPGLARWTNARGWESIGACDGGIESVWSLETFDPGDGPKLYAAGRYTSIGATGGEGGIGEWDGVAWGDIAGSINGTMDQIANVMIDDVAHLLLAGNYSSINHDGRLNLLTRWDGAQFHDEGLNAWILNTQVISQFGAGVDGFILEGGTIDPFAKLRSGSTWRQLPPRMGGAKEAWVWVPHAHLGGPALFMAGSGMAIRSGGFSSVMRLQADSWDPVGEVTAPLAAIALDTTVAPARLIAAGDNSVLSWDGSSGSPLGQSLPVGVDLTTALVWPHGPLAGAYVAGEGGLWRLEQGSWARLDPGFARINSLAIADLQDGLGEQLFVAGLFTGTEGMDNIARYDGAQWHVLSQGLNNEVYDLTVGDPGSGPRLFAAGRFTASRGLHTGPLAQWDGSTWSPLGQVLPGAAFSLAMFDDGHGPRLFASRASTPVRELVTWDGAVLESFTALPTTSADLFPIQTDDEHYLLLDLSSAPGAYPDGLAMIPACFLSCPADLTGSTDPNSPDYGRSDGVVDAADFFYYLDQFAVGNLDVADLTGSSDPLDPTYGEPDGVLDGSDFFYFLDLFGQGCV